jgi:hypothetical protein
MSIDINVSKAMLIQVKIKIKYVNVPRNNLEKTHVFNISKSRVVLLK